MAENDRLSFTFSKPVTEAHLGDLRTQIETIGDRINLVLQEAERRGLGIVYPIVRHPQISPDDLLRLAKVLNALAPLIRDLTRLQDQARVLEVVVADPGWMASAMGDFSEDIDQFLREAL